MTLMYYIYGWAYMGFFTISVIYNEMKNILYYRLIDLIDWFSFYFFEEHVSFWHEFITK